MKLIGVVLFSILMLSSLVFSQETTIKFESPQEINQTQVNFTADDGKNFFMDNILLLTEDYKKLSQDDLIKIAQQRFDAWLAALNYVPTAKYKQDMISALTSQIAAFTVEKEELEKEVGK